MKYSILLIGIICLLSSCYQTQESSESDRFRSSIKQDLNPPYLAIERKDSFRLGSDSGFFFDRVPEINTSLFKKNKQFVLSRANVVIGLIDTTGHFLKKITQKGEGPGQIFIARSAKAWEGKDGDTYVLTNANAFALNVFSKTGQFKYMVRLFNAIDDIYHPRAGFYHMSEKDNGKYTLTLSIASTRNSPFNSEYYEESHTIAQFTIDDITGKVTNASTKLPLKEYPEIKAGIANETISWGGQDAIFKEHDDKFYLTFPFSKKVYVYNKHFDEIKQISLKSFDLYDEGFSFKMRSSPEELFDRTYLQHRTYLENLYIKDLQVLDNTLIIQYLAPLAESDYLNGFPTKKSIEEEENWIDFFIQRDQMWLIHDLKTGAEKLIRLSGEHDKAAFIDKNRLLVTRNPDGVEDLFIFKYYLKESISDF